MQYYVSWKEFEMEHFKGLKTKKGQIEKIYA